MNLTHVVIILSNMPPVILPTDCNYYTFLLIQVRVYLLQQLLIKHTRWYLIKTHKQQRHKNKHLFQTCDIIQQHNLHQ